MLSISTPLIDMYKNWESYLELSPFEVDALPAGTNATVGGICASSYRKSAGVTIHTAYGWNVYPMLAGCLGTRERDK